MVVKQAPNLADLMARLPHGLFRRVWWRRWARRAAVTAVLRETAAGRAEVLLMQRAERDGDPWSGHMSFPGGRMDLMDQHVYETAVRELAEETGVQIGEQGHYLGRLSDVPARPWRWRQRPLVISAFVFALTAEPIWRPDPAEVQRLVWVPLDFLANPANRTTMTWQRGKISVQLPCYVYEGHRIWGVTLRMLDELMANG